MTVSIGPMRVSERPFVASTWLRSYEAAEVVGSGTPRSCYWRKFGELVDALLDAGETYVARNPEDETQALGWLCRARGDNTMHYVYARWLMRDRQHLGEPLFLASRLLGESGLNAERGLRCTFTTVPWLKYAAKHGIQFDHDRTLVSVTRAACRRMPQEEMT